MQIFLGFDGTIVPLQLPQIGQIHDGAIEVVKALIAAGHEIILNTVRADMDQPALRDAQAWLKQFGLELHYMGGRNSPGAWDPGTKTFVLWLDSESEGIPTNSDGTMDWVGVELELLRYGVLPIPNNMHQITCNG